MAEMEYRRVVAPAIHLTNWILDPFIAVSNMFDLVSYAINGFRLS